MDPRLGADDGKQLGQHQVRGFMSARTNARHIKLTLSLAVASLASACSPPGMLNALDRGYGSSGAGRIGSAIAFGTHGQTLDVWRPVRKLNVPRPGGIFWS